MLTLQRTAGGWRSIHRTCFRCGRRLRPMRYQGQSRKWCGPACRKAAQRARWRVSAWLVTPRAPDLTHYRDLSQVSR